jgi:hypothetical protein
MGAVEKCLKEIEKNQMIYGAPTKPWLWNNFWTIAPLTFLLILPENLREHLYILTKSEEPSMKRQGLILICFAGDEQWSYSLVIITCDIPLYGSLQLTKPDPISAKAKNKPKSNHWMLFLTSEVWLSKEHINTRTLTGMKHALEADLG